MQTDSFRHVAATLAVVVLLTPAPGIARSSPEDGATDHAELTDAAEIRPATPGEPAAPPVDAAGSVVPDVAVSQAAPAGEDDLSWPDRIAVGTNGYFRPGLLLQGWFIMDVSDEQNVDGDFTDTFRARRLEISARGDIVPEWVRYSFMIDPARALDFQEVEVPVEPADPDNPGETVTVRQPVSAVTILKDYYVTFTVPYVDISVGQFKIPVSWEGFNSSSRLLFPERATVSRLFGDQRDLGVRLSQRYGWFGFTAGVYNGAGANNLDTNDQKDLTLRLDFFPVEGLTLALVTYDSVGERDEPGTQDRWEADVRYENGPFLFQSEYIAARDVRDDGTTTYGHGFYGTLGWTFAEAWQPVIRVAYFDPDLDANGSDSDDEIWQFDAGLNWYIDGDDAKLQLSYSRFQYDERTPRNQVILAAQVHY